MTWMLAALVAIGSILGGCMPHTVGGKTAREVFQDATVASLAEAACEGNAEAVERFSNMGADVNSLGLEGVSPLLWALSCENFPGMEALLRVGADPNIRDDNRSTVVYYAASYHNSELLALLLRYGGDPNALNDSGYTPLTTALTYRMTTGKSENFDLLLEAGADISMQNQGGSTIVDIAAFRNQYDLVLRLLRSGYSGDLSGLLRTARISRVDPESPQSAAREEVIAYLEAELARAEGSASMP